MLRRMLRRATRFGRVLGMETPFIHKLVPTLAEVMGDAFPEIRQQLAHISRVIESEEASFGNTLDHNYLLLNSLKKYTKLGCSILSGISNNISKIIAFTVCGLCCSIAGLIQSARLGQIDPHMGIGWELTVIAIADIGGASLYRGKGSIAVSYTHLTLPTKA